MKVPRNNTALRELPVHGEFKLAPQLAPDTHADPYPFGPRYQMRTAFNATLLDSEIVRLRDAEWSSDESDDNEVVQEGTSFDISTEPCGSFAAPALAARPFPARSRRALPSPSTVPSRVPTLSLFPERSASLC